MGNGKKKSAKGTGKPWREFEILVKRIEESLCQKGAVVKSPDHIPDVVTGTSREVDASIRYQIGSTPILITIECRDRSAKEDVRWIEHLAQKKISLGVSETIAVSSKGFTAEAKQKGKILGIQLRKLDKITERDISAWMSIVARYNGVRPKLLTFTTDEPYAGVHRAFHKELIEKCGEEEAVHEKVIFSDTNSHVSSLIDFFWGYYYEAEEKNLFKGLPVPLNGESQEIELVIVLDQRGYYVIYRDVKLYLKRIQVNFVLYDREVELVSKEHYVYQGGDENDKLVGVSEFKDNDPNSYLTKFQWVHNFQTGKFHILAEGQDGETFKITPS